MRSYLKARWIQLVNVPKHAKMSLKCSFSEQMISETTVATKMAVIVSVKPAQKTTELVILFRTTAIVCTNSFNLVSIDFQLSHTIKTFSVTQMAFNSMKIHF